MPIFNTTLNIGHDGEDGIRNVTVGYTVRGRTPWSWEEPADIDIELEEVIDDETGEDYRPELDLHHLDTLLNLAAEDAIFSDYQ